MSKQCFKSSLAEKICFLEGRTVGSLETVPYNCSVGEI